MVMVCGGSRRMRGVSGVMSRFGGMSGEWRVGRYDCVGGGMRRGAWSMEVWLVWNLFVF